MRQEGWEKWDLQQGMHLNRGIQRIDNIRQLSQVIHDEN
jgi:hypothetical protein